MIDLTELRTHLSKNRVPYIVGALVSISTPLFLVIWRNWLYGVLARNAQAVPREALGAIIGVLIIFLLAALALIVLFARDLRVSETKNETLDRLAAELEQAEIENLALKTKLDGLQDQQESTTLELKQALAQLHAFNDNLPKNGDIEEKFVREYHDILIRIERETEHNLNAFRIEPNEVDHHVIKIPSRRRGSFVFTSPGTKLSEKRYCDREVFLMRLHGAMKFLAGFNY